jgi:hypothetical protein
MIYFLFKISRVALRSIYPPRQWVLELFPWGQSAQGMRLTTNLSYTHATVSAQLLQAPENKRMSENSSCVYSMIIQSQLTPSEHSVISMCNNTIYCPNNNDHKCYPTPWWSVCWKLNFSWHMLYNIFNLWIFLMRNHTMNRMTKHFVLVCMYQHKHHNGHDCPLPILELTTRTYMKESLWKAVSLLQAVSYNYTAP